MSVAEHLKLTYDLAVPLTAHNKGESPHDFHIIFLNFGI
jgi:hypothetical protein